MALKISVTWALHKKPVWGTRAGFSWVKFKLSRLQNTLYLLRCHDTLSILLLDCNADLSNYLRTCSEWELPKDRSLLHYTLSLTPAQCFSIQLSLHFIEWMNDERTQGKAKEIISSSWSREFHHQRKDSDLDPKTWVIKSTDHLAGLRGIQGKSLAFYKSISPLKKKYCFWHPLPWWWLYHGEQESPLVPTLTVFKSKNKDHIRGLNDLIPMVLGRNLCLGAQMAQQSHHRTQWAHPPSATPHSSGNGPAIPLWLLFYASTLDWGSLVQAGRHPCI